MLCLKSSIGDWLPTCKGKQM